jgi:hypothetical protein
VGAFADRIDGFGSGASDLLDWSAPPVGLEGGLAPPRLDPPMTAPLLDRRSSAALPPPLETHEGDRRNAVALSLAGLFDHSDRDGEAANDADAGPKPRPRRVPSFFDEEPEVVAPPPNHARRRALLSPGGILAVLAILGALYVVGYVVARSHPSKAPSPDQITTTH